MSETRELRVLRDSNAMMMQREALRKAELKAAGDKISELQAQVERLHREQELKERDYKSLVGQVQS